MKPPPSLSSGPAVWCKGCRGIMLVFVSRSEPAPPSHGDRSMCVCVCVFGYVWVCVCVCGIGVQKVKVTWSVPVTVQWENQSTPVNEVGQVHKPSRPRMDAHYIFFFFFVSICGCFVCLCGHFSSFLVVLHHFFHYFASFCSYFANPGVVN